MKTNIYKGYKYKYIMDTSKIEKKQRPYDVLNLKYNTKERIDKIYYSLKVKKKYKSYDDFINEVLDFFEKK